MSEQYLEHCKKEIDELLLKHGDKELNEALWELVQSAYSVGYNKGKFDILLGKT